MSTHNLARITMALSLVCLSTVSGAQEVNYSWLDLSYMGQNFERTGSQVPVPGQTVDINGTDGNGVRFRGSFELSKYLYTFVDYGSTDIDVAAVVTNDQGVFPADDKFDYTTIRGGLGVRFPVAFSADAYAEVSYDSLDLDLGSFALENFDMDDKGIGGSVGLRSMLTDDLEVRAYARFTDVGDANFDTKEFDSDTLFGVGIGWEMVRGLSLQADYESGEFSAWSLGFRLDLDED